MIQFRQTLEYLMSAGVDFIIVGGVAASLHGSSHATFDLDICYSRESASLEKLGKALIAINARLRNAPPGLPFKPDAETLRRGLNFTFETDLGTLDLLGEIAGVGTFAQAVSGAEKVDLFSVTYRVLSLPQLIAAKRAAGRTKDLLVLPELEALREIKEATQGSQHGDSQDQP